MSYRHTGFLIGGLHDGISVLVGSTANQLREPSRHKAAATINDAVQPMWAAIHGVSEAVRAAPIWFPVFMNPETTPEDPPAMSAVTDQKELWARYSAPAPPAITTLASLALCTCAPRVMKTPANAIATRATPQRPKRGP